MFELPSLTKSFHDNTSTSGMFDQRKSLDLQLKDLLERTEKFTQRANQFTGAASYVKSGFSKLTSTIDRFRDNVTTNDSHKTWRRRTVHLETIEDSFDDDDDSTELQWRKMVDDNRLIYEAIQLLKWRVRYPKPTFYEYSPSEGSPYSVDCSFHQSFQSPVIHTPTDEVAQRMQLHLERTPSKGASSCVETTGKCNKDLNSTKLINIGDSSFSEDVISPGAPKRSRFEIKEKIQEESSKPIERELEKPVANSQTTLTKQEDMKLPSVQMEDMHGKTNNDLNTECNHHESKIDENSSSSSHSKHDASFEHKSLDGRCSDIQNDMTCESDKIESVAINQIRPTVFDSEFQKTSTNNNHETAIANIVVEVSHRNESPLEKQAQNDLHSFQHRYSLKAAKFDESDVEMRLINRVPLKERLAQRRSQMQRTNTRVEKGNFVYRFYSE